MKAGARRSRTNAGIRSRQTSDWGVTTCKSRAQDFPLALESRHVINSTSAVEIGLEPASQVRV
jgi:hypothetical protein